jgi:hypothetical protein
LKGCLDLKNGTICKLNQGRLAGGLEFTVTCKVDGEASEAYFKTRDQTEALEWVAFLSGFISGRAVNDYGDDDSDDGAENDLPSVLRHVSLQFCILQMGSRCLYGVT